MRKVGGRGTVEVLPNTRSISLLLKTLKSRRVLHTKNSKKRGILFSNNLQTQEIVANTKKLLEIKKNKRFENFRFTAIPEVVIGDKKLTKHLFRLRTVNKLVGGYLRTKKYKKRLQATGQLGGSTKTLSGQVRIDSRFKALRLSVRFKPKNEYVRAMQLRGESFKLVRGVQADNLTLILTIVYFIVNGEANMLFIGIERNPFEKILNENSLSFTGTYYSLRTEIIEIKTIEKYLHGFSGETNLLDYTLSKRY